MIDRIREIVINALEEKGYQEDCGLVIYKDCIYVEDEDIDIGIKITIETTT